MPLPLIILYGPLDGPNDGRLEAILPNPFHSYLSRFERSRNKIILVHAHAFGGMAVNPNGISICSIQLQGNVISVHGGGVTMEDFLTVILISVSNMVTTQVDHYEVIRG